MHRFDPAEVVHLLYDRAARAVDPSKEGERDARVFESLEAGKGLRAIVTTLRLPADVASKLVNQWREDGRRDFVIPVGCRAELEQSIGGFRDAVELVQLVRLLEADRERLENEANRVGSRMSDVIIAIGKSAAETLT